MIDEFDIDQALLEANEYHNNHIHKSTKYKPVDIRDTADKQIIEIVNNNIKNYYNKKIEKSYENLLKEGDYLIVNDNIKLSNSKNNPKVLVIKNKNKKGNFVIPAIFNKYLKNGYIEITIKKIYYKTLKLIIIIKLNQTYV